MRRETRELKSNLAIAQGRTAFAVRPDIVKAFDANLIASILPLGLKLACAQYQIATSDKYNPVCKEGWGRVFDVPYAHDIKGLLDYPTSSVLSVL